MSDRPSQTTNKRPIETIVLDSDSEEEEDDDAKHRDDDDHHHHQDDADRREQIDLERAIRASLLDAACARQEQLEEQQEQELRRQPVGHYNTQGGGGASLNVFGGGTSRREMERERLDRVDKISSKRNHSTTTSSSSSSLLTSKRPRIATLSDLAPLRRGPSSSSRAAGHEMKESVRFWSGSIQTVSNRHDDDNDDDDNSRRSFSFKQLVGSASTLTATIVSAFVLDPDWVVAHFPPECPTLLIMPRLKGGGGESVKDVPDGRAIKITTNDPESRIRGHSELYRVIPTMRDMGAWSGGCMHTKLLVYFHKDFCRIVIPTANAIEYDWSIIDNAFYVQDFPLLVGDPRPSTDSNSPQSPFDNPTLTQFSKNFIQIIAQLGAPKAFVSRFAPYDFSASDHVRLVHSIQGKYTEADKFDKGGGLASLARAVESLGFQPGGKWDIEATGSSIGRYTPTWLIQFLSSCQGIHPTSYFTHDPSRGGPSSKTSRRYPIDPVVTTKTGPFDWDLVPLKIAFPTNAAVAGSIEGVFGGGTIFCPKATWNAKTFPRRLFHRGESKRDKVVAHTKMILATHKINGLGSNDAAGRSPKGGEDEDEEKYEGWVYVGSHNLTPSAWGNLQDGQNGKQLAMNNYELGVVVPIRMTTKEEFEREANDVVTYKRPLVRYDSATDRPWMQDEYPEIFSSNKPTRPGAH
ncbi:hypothetical protein JCM3766R1_004158 [Sporobolomyces carnicolor]